MQNVINPITEFREEHNLQQKELAHYARVSSQVVMRAEQGLYNHLPPSIAEAIGILDTDIGFTIGEDYHKWQIITLEMNREIVKEKMPLLYAAGKTDTGITNFRQWRECFSDSVMGFCKIFLTQQAIIAKYESGKMDNLPEIVIERLNYFSYGYVADVLKGLPPK